MKNKILKKEKFDECFKLFYIFFKIGLFTFGGGYSMVLFMKREFVNNHKYLDEKEYLEMLGVSQITPGPIAVNMATFIGYRVSGFLGSFFSTLAVTLPSFIVILIIAIFFKKFQDILLVQKFLKGVLIGIVAQIAFAVLDLGKSLKKDFFNVSLSILSLVLILFFNLNPINMIIIGALLGIAIRYKTYKSR